MPQESRSVAILWDAENINPKSLKSLVDAVTEYADQFGRISVAYAFGDWTKGDLKHSDEVLARASFQLVQIPKGRKNSADISMVTSGMELLFLYPHVATYVLVTGDSDFRPLLVSMRRRGAETAIVCDAQSASEDLLALADHYTDYRDLLADDEDDQSPDQTNGEKTSITREQAFSLLVEAIAIMQQNKKTATLGPTKIRLKLLNDSFDERDLGYRSWKGFVLDAKDKGYIDIESRESDLVLSLRQTSRQDREGLAAPFTAFLVAIRDAAGKDPRREVSFASVGKLLKEQDVDYRKFGYKSLKTLAKAAEKRGLVEISYRNLEPYVNLTAAGASHG